MNVVNSRVKKTRIFIVAGELVGFRSPRLPRQIKTLVNNGYSVTVLSWDMMSESASGYQQVEEAYKEIRLKLRAPGKTWVILFPIWWCFVFYQLMVRRWDIVHANNISQVVPTLIASKMKRKPIIYEIYDLFEFELPLPKLVGGILFFIDKIFMYLSTSVIVTNEAQGEYVRKSGNSNICVVHNTPADFSGELGTTGKNQGDGFSILCAVGLYRARRLNIDKVVLAIKDIDDIQLVIAGDGDQVGEIEELASGAAGKVKFLGRVNYHEALQLTAQSNLVIAVYDPARFANRVGTPNKLFEAMMCSKPVLVCKGTAMADIVEREGCGLTVDCSSIEGIRGAILKLKRDPELCKTLGVNGRRAYEQKYNWEIMSQCLLTLYQQSLLQKAMWG